MTATVPAAASSPGSVTVRAATWSSSSSAMARISVGEMVPYRSECHRV
ncbi:hypothetical protein [Streptomyces bluensis]